MGIKSLMSPPFVLLPLSPCECSVPPFENTVKPRPLATLVIRSPRYYGRFFWPPGKKPLLIRQNVFGPLVTVLTEFSCNCKPWWSTSMFCWSCRFVTLSPGDVVITGTPPGVGVFRKPPVFLKVCTLSPVSFFRDRKVVACFLTAVIHTATKNRSQIVQIKIGL